MKRFAKIVGILLLAWIIYRPVTHFLCVPSAVRASWVEPLATTGTRFYHQRELFTGGEEALKVWDELEPVFSANDQKRKLFATVKSGVGSRGLLRRYSTVEGRPILAWVLVQDGRITFVKDCSRDGGAPPWAVYKRVPLDFSLGFMRENKFVEGEPSPADSPVIVFQIQVHNLLDSQQIDTEYFC
jgi:hypothetical protein